MAPFYSAVFVEQQSGQPRQQPGFWRDNELADFGYDPETEPTLSALTFKVRRKPQDLLAHLRRIYFCYQHHLSAQLYAALLDFLIALQGRCEPLSRRIIEASRSRLDKRHFSILTETTVPNLRQSGNRYSLFTTGLQGTSELLEYRRKTVAQQDALALANDFIEYSQLEQAMDVLETAISLHPDRADLQQALLELYQSTGNRARFQSMWRMFSQTAVPLVDNWALVAEIFKGDAP